MTIKYALLSAALAIALASPVFGRDNLADTARADTKRPDLSSMMGKPTADVTIGGIHMKVWLMTQDQHKEMMKEKTAQRPTYSEQEGGMGKMEATGMNPTTTVMAKEMKGLQPSGTARKDTSRNTGIDTVEAIQASRSMTKPMVDSAMAGTHHIMLEATERASGKEIPGASARVLIESPSKKSSTVELKPMMQHFGSALTLDEKGVYRFTVNVSYDGVTRTTQFQHAVK